MKSYLTISSGPDKLLPWTWALLWFSLPLSLKATVILIWAFGLLVLISSFIQKPVIRKERLIPALVFTIFFAWHIVSSLLHPSGSGLKELEKYLPLLIIPWLLLVARQKKHSFEKWAMRGFIAGLVVSGSHMVINALLLTLKGEGAGAWTYHQFTETYHLGAIYFSWYLAAVLLYLAFREPERFIARYRFVLMAFLLVLMLLSASKLIIGVTVPLLLWGILRNLAGLRNKWLVTGLLAVIVILGSVPFIKRAQELNGTDLGILRQQEYSYDTPFNGITLRLVQWRFALIILEDQQAWLTGTGPGNKQALLDEQYRKFGVYTGNPELGDSGYLGYNFHNQYVETLVGTGFAGFLTLLVLLAFILTARGQKLVLPPAFFVLTMFFFITESVLERQAGIVFFALAACTINLQGITTETTDGSSNTTRDHQPGSDGSTNRPAAQQAGQG